MKIALPILVAATAITGLAAVATSAQTTSSQPASNSERINRVIVYGDDPCPQSSGDEIVVCARRPDNDRYRIPETFREGDPVRDGESWASRARSLEYIGRTGIQSCSTVGPGGYTGCWAEMMRQAREDRRQNPQPRR